MQEEGSEATTAGLKGDGGVLCPKPCSFPSEECDLPWLKSGYIVVDFPDSVIPGSKQFGCVLEWVLGGNMYVAIHSHCVLWSRLRVVQDCCRVFVFTISWPIFTLPVFAWVVLASR